MYIVLSQLTPVNQKAIARYFGEKDLDYDKIFRAPTKENRTEAYMLLRPQYWKGQQHGGKSAEIHARHLRPLCETVSSGMSKALPT